jgi:hypothetical protein
LVSTTAEKAGGMRGSGGGFVVVEGAATTEDTDGNATGVYVCGAAGGTEAKEAQGRNEYQPGG